MKALDTNILIRFLIQDDKTQTEKVVQLLTHTEKNKKTFFVPILVSLEMIWVLQSVYQVNRKDIILAFNQLLQMPVLEFENQTSIREFLISANTFTGDLSDMLIAQTAHEANCQTTLTFDNKASKYPLFTLLT